MFQIGISSRKEPFERTLFLTGSKKMRTRGGLIVFVTALAALESRLGGIRRIPGFHTRGGLRDPFKAVKKRRNSTARHAAPQSDPRRRVLIASALVLLVVGIASGFTAWLWLRQRPSAPKAYVPRRRGQLTFNKDIAPIMFHRCARCHRPGQSAPFALLSYQDARKHATDIVDVTARRYMPPWLPEQGYGDFMDERRLSIDEIGMIEQWVTEGQVEGSPADLPPAPNWSSDWQLGKPDLVVSLPETYTLAAERRDVYRNFVVPIPLTVGRYVRGVEFHPGNPKVVHHTFVKVDRTSQSRRLDARDAEPGYPGMNTPAEMPDGHFLGWQPGRMPGFLPDGLSWRLDPGNDLVLQIHLNPSGKPERVQPSIGLYFTEQAPTNTCFKMSLTSLIVDIPAGATDYVVQDSYVLPVDVQVLAVLPHAHYLAKEMQGWATLPDGSRRWLLFIKQWDFNWQGDYRYAQPVTLPKGSTLAMRFTYDNSTNNVRNPNHPPKPVAYGAQSSDEMAELWFQLLPRNRQELSLLSSDYQSKMVRVFLDSDLYALRKNPNDAKAHYGLGMILMNQNRRSEAEQHFRAAIQVEPEYQQGHYGLGLLLRQQGQLAEARTEFETALRLDPNDHKAHGNLGFILIQQSNFQEAENHLRAALEINPDDALARDALADLEKLKRAPGR